MALNFSHRRLLPAHISDDNMISPSRIASGYLVDCYPEKNGDGDSVSKDVLDLLPTDPFGMNMATTFSAITGWLENLEVDYRVFESDERETGVGDGNNHIFAGLNFLWNNAMRFQEQAGSIGVIHKSLPVSEFDDYMEKGGDVSCSGHSVSASTTDRRRTYDDNGAPHPALNFTLAYLGVRDLLVVQRVCRTLYSVVHEDPLLWRSIHIDQPLNDKITDDILLQLTNKAQGSLQCLILVECSKITDDGLRRVLETNPRLTKLSVPGCTRLSIEGLLSCFRDLNSMGKLGVKHLRIGGIYGVTLKHFEELKFLLGTDNLMLQNVQKPRIYNRRNVYLSFDDDPAIDIEICPICQCLRLVYDCPVEGCRAEEHVTQVCRGCTLCIARCVDCGRCINDGEYEETFCLELLCSCCLTQLLENTVTASISKIG